MSILPEMSIVDAATEVLYFEHSQPFAASMTVDLGKTFDDINYTQFFAARTATSDIRNFRIDGVHLDTCSMVLIKDGKKIHETRYTTPDDEYLSLKVDSREVITLDEGPLHTIVRANHNYYHWLIQSLPAIDLSLRSKSLDHAALALGPGDIGQIHREFLEYLGYGDVPQVVLDVAYNYFIPHVEYCEFVNGSVSYAISLAQRGTFQRLIDRVGGHPNREGRTIYVARTDTPNRLARNEQELIDGLLKTGIEVVVPGSLSIPDQINVFRGASAVIGPHGAGLSNIVFCKPGTIFYEFFPSHYINPCFNRLAQVGGLDYIADIFDGDLGSGTEHQKQWVLNPNVIMERIRIIQSRLS